MAWFQNPAPPHQCTPQGLCRTPCSPYSMSVRYASSFRGGARFRTFNLSILSHCGDPNVQRTRAANPTSWGQAERNKWRRNKQRGTTVDFGPCKRNRPCQETFVLKASSEAKKPVLPKMAHDLQRICSASS